MKNIILAIALVLPVSFSVQASESSIGTANQSKTVKSPSNRVAMLELYTSEGCSSCPPADKFLNNLKAEGISEQQLIPLAFHVTYWDYIGWKDRFAKAGFDARQRDLAHKNKQKTVYTPQFVLIGDDFRRYSRFSENVNAIVAEQSEVDLVLTVSKHVDEFHIQLASTISDAKVKDVGLYLAIVENNLSSDVADGENEGETLLHNYVVRQLSTPYFHSKPEVTLEREHVIAINPEWKKEDLSIVAFAENPHTGEILQAVKYNYEMD